MTVQKRVLAIFLIILLPFAANLTAYAHETPDNSKSGSISVSMVYNHEAVSGGSLTLYRVAEVSEDNGNYGFALTEEFTGSGISLVDLSSVPVESFAAYAADHNLIGITANIGSDGTVLFSDLKLGLYLLVQNQAADGYKAATPFLVSVPIQEKSVYRYDVDASPKVELEKSPVTPPTTNPTAKPTDPSLPQTGQLNWPVPVLAVLGMSLLMIGWILRHGKKGTAHEA